MADLTTNYLGFTLQSPIVASASPLTRDVAAVHALCDAGVGAIVLPSLFEEEVVHEELELHRVHEGTADHHPEALGYFPALPDFPGPCDRYLADLERVKSCSPIPVIASLNASSAGGWMRYARLFEDAGADAVELNLYRVAADPFRSAAEVEATDIEVIAAVRAELTMPLAVKLSPYYSALANFAARAVDAGADALVLFNRFYQPDIDLEALDVVPSIELSHPWELRLPLRWIAIVRPLLPDVSLAATSGISQGTDVVKALLVGADVVMTTSALLRRGPTYVATLERQLREWMDEHDYASVAQLRGSASHATSVDPSSFERANYVRTLHSWSTR
jgi:dihydroorotate dehydrogenase (fumarate)